MTGQKGIKMEEIKSACSCGILSDNNMMEENKEQIIGIICKTRNFIENVLCQNRLHNGNSFNDRLYFNLHKIIVGEAAIIMMMSGIYDSDGSEEVLGEILGDFNIPEDIMVEESLDCITKCLLNRGEL